MTGNNPYAAPQTVPGSAPNPANDEVWGGPGRYSVKNVPESTDPNYRIGFSPELAVSGSADGSMLPSDIRIGKRQPPPNDSNDREYNQRRSSEHLSRHSEERSHSTGWRIEQRRPYTPPVPDQVQEKAPIRPTASMSPASSTFWRPWHRPRPATDIAPNPPETMMHFSLADHKRLTKIMGMKPQGGVQPNTYRASMRPWDAQLFIPPEAENTSATGVFGNRSYRAG